MSCIENIVALSTAKPGQIDALCAAAKPWIAASRVEPGCLRFDLNRDVEHPDRLVLIASWANREAHQAHGRTQHVQQFIAASAPFLVTVEILRLTPVD